MSAEERDEALVKARRYAADAEYHWRLSGDGNDHALRSAEIAAGMSQAFTGIALTIDAIDAGVPVVAVVSDGPPPFNPDPRLMGHMEKGQHRPEDGAR